MHGCVVSTALEFVLFPPFQVLLVPFDIVLAETVQYTGVYVVLAVVGPGSVVPAILVVLDIMLLLVSIVLVKDVVEEDPILVYWKQEPASAFTTGCESICAQVVLTHEPIVGINFAQWQKQES